MGPLTVEEAKSRAIAAAGAGDFGPGGFEEGLQRTLNAIARVPLTAEGLMATNEKIVADLANRLRIERWFKAHPEVAQQEIDGPVLVIGMPRTGTTATVAMLALDERFRFLRAWEGADPLPPPIAEQEDRDPRAIAARVAANRYTKPSMHLHDPDGPEEDLVFIAGLDMHAYHGLLPMPDEFLDWWIDADFTSTYAYHARVLKLLQSQRPPHLWLLKAPPHLFKLEAFAAQYPNAKFVMTHRDPRKLIPSVASLQYTLHTVRCRPEALDKHEIGAKSVRFWAEGIRRAFAARTKIGEHRFIDIKNDDVVRDPLGVFGRVYDHLGMRITPQLERKLADYRTRNAPGAFGAHSYTLEEYGLSADSVGAAFKDYIERFAF
jgi:sulfotransferase family protein